MVTDIIHQAAVDIFTSALSKLDLSAEDGALAVPGAVREQVLALARSFAALAVRDCRDAYEARLSTERWAYYCARAEHHQDATEGEVTR